jgi:hypothetical protein
MFQAKRFLKTRQPKQLLQITENAQKRLNELREQGKGKLRISLKNKGCSGLSYTDYRYASTVTGRYYHTVTRRYNHTVTRRYNHTVTRRYNHTVT